MKRSEIYKNFIFFNKKIPNAIYSEIEDFSIIFSVPVKINGFIFSKFNFLNQKEIK